MVYSGSDKKKSDHQLRTLSHEPGSSSASDELKASNSTTLETGDILSFSQNGTYFNKFINSFKRLEGDDGQSKESVDDLEGQTRESSQPGKGLKARHVALIAMAGGLGTGLLVGNGKALTMGGPLGLIIAYIIVGSMLFSTILAAGELAVEYSSITGGFNAYAAKLVDPSLGFAVAWNYAINWFTVLPLEMVTASMTIKFWCTTVNPDVFVAIFFTFIVVVNLFGAKGYAEAEFWFNLAKVLMLSGFIILGLLIDTGTVGNGGYIGHRFFKDPGLFANGFKGVCAVFVTSAFSLGGTEFMALTAADQKNPGKAIPAATKQVFYRLIFFYILSIIVVGLLVPYNSPHLMGSGQNNGAPVSPYVLAVESYGIKVIPHVINAVILIAVLSVGNSALYSSSRTFYSLAKQGFAPKWFDYVDRENRPIRAMMVSIICGLFSFIAAYKDQEYIFTWLLSLSGLSTIFTWSTICISHIRFRSALKAQGRSVSQLGFRVPTGVFSSYYAIALNIFILGAQFWVSLFPIGGEGNADIASLFQNYLGMISFLLFYSGHKIYLIIKRRDILVFPYISADEVDLDRESEDKDIEFLELENKRDAELLKNGPLVNRIIDFFF
jgi:amino acid transporter